MPTADAARRWYWAHWIVFRFGPTGGRAVQLRARLSWKSSLIHAAGMCVRPTAQTCRRILRIAGHRPPSNYPIYRRLPRLFPVGAVACLRVATPFPAGSLVALWGRREAIGQAAFHVTQVCLRKAADSVLQAGVCLSPFAHDWSSACHSETIWRPGRGINLEFAPVAAGPHWWSLARRESFMPVSNVDLENGVTEVPEPPQDVVPCAVVSLQLDRGPTQEIFYVIAKQTAGRSVGSLPRQDPAPSRCNPTHCLTRAGRGAGRPDFSGASMPRPRS